MVHGKLGENMEMFFRPFDRMWERVSIAQDHSDTDFFNALMYTGEMLTKFVTCGMVAAIANDRDRHRYRQLYLLARADGIGDWVRVLDDTLTGPAAQYLFSEVYEEQNQLTKNCGIDSWQFKAVSTMDNCLRIVVPENEPLASKVQARRWFSLFAQLRNKTRAHGAPPADRLTEICPLLSESIWLFSRNFSLFNRSWGYLYKSLSGKYRVTKWTEQAQSLDPLKTQLGQRYNFKNGVYIHFDGSESFSALARVDLIESDSEATDFFVANGGFTDQRFEMLSYISGDKKSENSSPYLSPVTELPPSETEGLHILVVQQNSFATLPPLQKEYIHRL
jgi:hypothetical protein